MNARNTVRLTDPSYDLDGQRRKKKSWWGRNGGRVMGGIKLGLGVAALFACTVCGIAAGIGYAWTAYDTYRGYKRGGWRGAASAATDFIPVVGRWGARAKSAYHFSRVSKSYKRMKHKRGASRYRSYHRRRGVSARNWGHRWGRRLDRAAFGWSAISYGRDW